MTDGKLSSPSRLPSQKPAGPAIGIENSVAQVRAENFFVKIHRNVRMGRG